MKGAAEWLANGTPRGSEEAENEQLLDGVDGVTEVLAPCPMAWRARFTLLSSSSWLRKADRSGKWTSLGLSVLLLREPGS